MRNLYKQLREKKILRDLSFISFGIIIGIITGYIVCLIWVHPIYLQNIIEKANKYSRAITSFATLFLVIATIALVKATLKLEEVNKKMWVSQHKPWLYFYVLESCPIGFINTLNIDLFVKNVGKGPAIKINFKIEDEKSEEIGEHKYKSLSPSEEIKISDIANINSTVQLSSSKIRIFSIKYMDLNGIEITQENVDPEILNSTALSI